MENEVKPVAPITQTTIQTPITVQPTPNKSNWFKILLFAVLGLLFLTGAVYAGIQIGKGQTPSQQPIVTQPTTSPTQTAVDPTAEWKTFTHPTYKYQFKYPQNWSAVVSKDASANTLFGLNTTSQSGLGGVEIREIPIEPQNFHNMTQSIVTDSTQLTINGISGYKMKYSNVVSGTDFVFKNGDGLIYNIYINSDNSDDLVIFNNILSTFKFIQVTPTKTLDSGWIKKSETRFENANGCLWFDITIVDSTQNLVDYLKKYFQTTDIAGFLNNKQYDVAGYDSKTISSQGIGELFSLFLKRNNQIYSFSFNTAVPEGGSNDFIDMCQTYQKENDINSAINSLSSFL